ncbi:hypothetical protein CsSME_00002482 [Camellia sinensis var. sinensis]
MSQLICLIQDIETIRISTTANHLPCDKVLKQTMIREKGRTTKDKGKRLTLKLGSYSIDDKGREAVAWIKPFPDTKKMVPSAIRTLSCPEEGEYAENKSDDPDIWLEAPESIIQSNV